MPHHMHFQRTTITASTYADQRTSSYSIVGRPPPSSMQIVRPPEGSNSFISSDGFTNHDPLLPFPSPSGSSRARKQACDGTPFIVLSNKMLGELDSTDTDDSVPEQSGSLQERSRRRSNMDDIPLRQPSSPNSVSNLFKECDDVKSQTIMPHRRMLLSSTTFICDGVLAPSEGNHPPKDDITPRPPQHRRSRSVSFAPRVRIRHIATRQSWTNNTTIQPSSIWYTRKELQKIRQDVAVTIKTLERSGGGDYHIPSRGGDDCVNHVRSSLNDDDGGDGTSIGTIDNEINGDDDIDSAHERDNGRSFPRFHPSHIQNEMIINPDDTSIVLLGLERTFGLRKERCDELQEGGLLAVLTEQEIQRSNGYTCDELIRSYYCEYGERAQDEALHRADTLVAHIKDLDDDGEGVVLKMKT